MATEPDDLRDVTSAVQDYAKAIYALSEKAAGAAVTTNALAQRLGVTAASASGMVRKLAASDLATHEPYHGVRLTPEGERVALEILRHHRLLELYLVEYLGVPLDRVHDEAEALEHVISEDLEARIAAKLGDPVRDPHGDPIPSVTLEIEAELTRSLNDVEPGDRGHFVRVSDSDPEMLRYLLERGISIGDSFELLDRQPFDGPLTVRFGTAEHVLGRPLAAAMRVTSAG